MSHETRDAASAAESEILESLYPDLSRAAHIRILREPFGYLWSPAALINETYIRIVSVYGKQWVRKPGLLALWAHVMNNVLVDHARMARSVKRSWGRQEVWSEFVLPPVEVDLDNRIAVRRACGALARQNPRAMKAIALTLFEGLTVDQAAPRLNVTGRTVKRAVRAGKHELRRMLH